MWEVCIWVQKMHLLKWNMLTEFNWTNEDYPAGPGIIDPLPERSSWCGSKSSYLENDVYVWRYARNERMNEWIVQCWSWCVFVQWLYLVLVFLCCPGIIGYTCYSHLLRVDLHVFQVNVQVDYIQPKSAEFQEKTCCTVTINNVWVFISLCCCYWSACTWPCPGLDCVEVRI